MASGGWKSSPARRAMSGRASWTKVTNRATGLDDLVAGREHADAEPAADPYLGQPERSDERDLGRRETAPSPEGNAVGGQILARQAPIRPALEARRQHDR